MNFPIKLYGGHLIVNKYLVLSVLTFICGIIVTLSTQVFPSISMLFLKFDYQFLKKDDGEILDELEHKIMDAVNNKTII